LEPLLFTIVKSKKKILVFFLEVRVWFAQRSLDTICQDIIVSRVDIVIDFKPRILLTPYNMLATIGDWFNALMSCFSLNSPKNVCQIQRDWSAIASRLWASLHLCFEITLAIQLGDSSTCNAYNQDLQTYLENLYLH
jgi:hypothetical protein